MNRKLKLGLALALAVLLHVAVLLYGLAPRGLDGLSPPPEAMATDAVATDAKSADAAEAPSTDTASIDVDWPQADETPAPVAKPVPKPVAPVTPAAAKPVPDTKPAVAAVVVPKPKALPATSKPVVPPPTPAVKVAATTAPPRTSAASTNSAASKPAAAAVVAADSSYANRVRQHLAKFAGALPPGATGEARVQFVVLPNGKVSDVHLVRFSGHAGLDAVALSLPTEAQPLPLPGPVAQRLEVPVQAVASAP